MSARHVLDELSAYIDGECPDAQRIGRHLQSCPACARRHMELLKLSHHLRAVRPPDVDALFLTRVLARVENSEPSRPWYLPFTTRPRRVLALALAACLAVMSAGIYFSMEHDPAAPAPSPLAADNTSLLDDDVALLAVAELLDEGAWSDPLLGDEPEGDPGAAPTVDELLDALALWTSDDEGAGWYDQDDLAAVLDALSEVDARVLGELTQTQWDEV